MSSNPENQPDVVGERPYDYKPDELVVALPHLNLVLGVLNGGLGPADPTAEVRRSDILGLALIPLRTSQEAVDRIVAEAREVRKEQGEPLRDEPFPDQGRALEKVLWSLRRIIAARYGGWTPSLGKNRFVGRVHGVGEISHGAGVDPPKGIPAPAQPPRKEGPGAGVRVGVLDTRVFPQPWLAGGWVSRPEDVDVNEPNKFAEGHATFVTGCILSQAPAATVQVRRVLGSDGTAESWDVAEEIVRFGRDLDILNLSFVCHTEDGEAPLVLATAIDRLDPDLVVVAAAGNHGRHSGRRVKPAWPAALRARHRGWGGDAQMADPVPFSPDAPWVDIRAAGDWVHSTYPKGRIGDKPFDTGWAKWSGTSFAAALMSGKIAAVTDRPSGITARKATADILNSLPKRVTQGVKPDPAGPAPFLPLDLL